MLKVTPLWLTSATLHWKQRQMLFPTAVVFCYIKNVQNIIHDMNIDDCIHHGFVASKFSFDS